MRRRNPLPETFFGAPWPANQPSPQIETAAAGTTAVKPVVVSAAGSPYAKWPLPSSMRNEGQFTRFACPLLVALFVGYLTTANGLPTGANLRLHYVSVVALVLATLVVAGIEGLRTIRLFDGERYRGRLVAVIKLNALLAWIVFAVGALNLVSLHYNAQSKHEREQRNKIEQEQAVARELARQVKEAEGLCESQKTKEVELLAKRRNIALAEHKNCMVEWKKPGFLSTETAEQACASKLTIHMQLVAAVRERQSRKCIATGTIGKK